MFRLNENESGTYLDLAVRRVRHLQMECDHHFLLGLQVLDVNLLVVKRRRSLLVVGLKFVQLQYDRMEPLTCSRNGSADVYVTLTSESTPSVATKFSPMAVGGMVV